MKDNQYAKLRERQQSEFNNLPLGFAFSDEQFQKMMKGWGLNPERDLDKITRIPYGGFIQKKDVELYRETLKRHEQELFEAIASDETGAGFICDMFDYELGNHEYTYTWDITDAVEAAGFTIEDVQKDERLMNGLSLACKSQREWLEKNG